MIGFYTRTERDGTVQVTTNPVYYYLRAGLIVAFLIPSLVFDSVREAGLWFAVPMWSFWLVLGFHVVAGRRVRGEIRDAIKSSSVTVSGSMWSFQKPMTVSFSARSQDAAGQA